MTGGSFSIGHATAVIGRERGVAVFSSKPGG